MPRCFSYQHVPRPSLKMIWEDDAMTFYSGHDVDIKISTTRLLCYDDIVTSSRIEMMLAWHRPFWHDVLLLSIRGIWLRLAGVMNDIESFASNGAFTPACIVDGWWYFDITWLLRQRWWRGHRLAVMRCIFLGYYQASLLYDILLLR